MKYLIKKRLFAILFILGLFSYSGWNLVLNGKALGKEISGMVQEGQIDTGRLEDRMEDKLPERIALVETYGLFQKLLQKREFNDFEYIRDENGYLNYAMFYREDPKDLFDCALRVRKLQDYVGQYGTKVLVVIPPCKYDKKKSVFLTGMPVNDPSSDVIEFMVYLNRLGVEAVNFGDYLPDEKVPYESFFFRTDHHWTVPAAFEATGLLVDTIKDRFGEDLDPTGYYTNPDSYEIREYYGHMLGTMGRGTGILYSGTEDFTAYFPRFKGNYTRTVTSESDDVTTYSGSFEAALMDMSVLQNDIDIYDTSQYSLYINQVKPHDLIINNENPDGPSIGMVRDSFFGPVIAFLSPMCSRIDSVYSLEEIDDFKLNDYLEEVYEAGEGYDYFILEYYPYNLIEEAFKFYRGEE